MNETIQDNPLRKVAILVASLDSEWSERVLGSLPADQAAIVRQRVELLTDIDPEEERTILAEFRHSLAQSAQPQNEGVELDISLQDRIRKSDYAPSAVPNRRPLETLSEADTSFIVDMLVGEHPQTIALVLSRLETEHAVDVLSEFSPSDQADVMQRLAELDTIDEESVEVVESQVARWIAEERQRKLRMNAGMDLVERIMSKTPSDQRERMVTEFSKKNSVFALRLSREQVQSPTQVTDGKVTLPVDHSEPRFEPTVVEPLPPTKDEPKNPFANHTTEQCLIELESLDKGRLLRALSQCESHVVCLALVGASEKLMKRVLAGRSRREAKQFRKSLREIGPTRLSDILAAQQEILFAESLLHN
ncbi:Flagellar motor switch protein FliG [Bythopirellula goksoeyrii]|uniref:Flagellar motor switch protein FliG n=2 Tax=Bythopirellula goksoeyrii TaxID=1400387 RepID=A0A5B9Q694_9BACT|nr:Flagellar motor switch protein FliG [Bythopirellula goksoeyrii]